MDIKLINLPLYYGCDNPGTHLAPMEFSRQNIASLAERCGNRIAGINILSVPPKPENPYEEPTMKYLEQVTDCCVQLADAVNDAMQAQQFPLVIGGDHSLGIGSVA